MHIQHVADVHQKMQRTYVVVRVVCHRRALAHMHAVRSCRSLSLFFGASQPHQPRVKFCAA